MDTRNSFARSQQAVLLVLCGLVSGRYRQSAVYLIIVLLFGWCFFLSLRQVQLSYGRIDPAKMQLREFCEKVRYDEPSNWIDAALYKQQNKVVYKQVETFEARLDIWHLRHIVAGWLCLTVLLTAGFFWLARIYVGFGLSKVVGDVAYGTALLGGLMSIIWVIPYFVDALCAVISFLWNVIVSTWNLTYWLATSQEYLHQKVVVCLLAVGVAVAYDLWRRGRPAQ